MVTIAGDGTQSNPDAGLDYRGLSSDTKPTENVPNGSTFLEMNTGNVYIFDKENSSWRQL